MLKKGCLYVIVAVLAVSCYIPRRDCAEFREGTFRFTTITEGEELSTTFVRNGEIEVDYFEGRADTSSVRWINDCEYITRKLNPANKTEEKSVHMKILSTTDSSYTFEYGFVGSAQKSRGTAIKIE